MKIWKSLNHLSCGLSLFASSMIVPSMGPVAAAEASDKLVLVGKVPGRYLTGKAKTQSFLASVVIENGIIKSVTPIAASAIANLSKNESGKVIVLGNASKNSFDVIYPGLFDLHNHTKQNMLPVWDEAHGQFGNRFEWRDWSRYTEAVSQNMNPWIKDYGGVVECAAFRWSELQAMVLGTTYLQGPSSCVTDFAIHHVEGGDGFLFEKTDAAGKPIVAKLNVQAPTDIVDPDSNTFVWDEVRPNVLKGDSFSKALEKVVFKKCPDLKEKINAAYDKSTTELQNALKSAEEKYAKKQDSKTLASVEDARYSVNRELMLDKGVLKIITDKPLLEKNCSDVHPKFLRYMSFYHPTIAGKIDYVNHPHRSSIIAHLSEGRRLDPYNMVEFELLKIFGLDKKNFNLIHGVGIDTKGFKHMATKGMGLIWSPFSNFLLYGQTADILAAHKAGVKLALGSDWTPTGSKSVLEELKIARNYVKQAGIATTFNDEYLYKMVTENSAEMINQLEVKEGDGHHGAGKVVADAIASLIIVKEKNKNPHTNLITAEAGDINLVLIKGKPLYGNVSYLKKYDASVEYESMPAYYEGLNQLVQADDKGVATGSANKLPTLTLEELKQADAPAKLLLKIASSKVLKELEAVDSCNFAEEKGFVFQNSLKANTASSKTSAADNMILFEKETGLNLDRAGDIEKLLGSLLLTQSKNITGQGNVSRSVTYMPSLHSCNDQKYAERFANFMADSKTKKDEYKDNMEFRIEFRREQQDKLDKANAANPAKPRMSGPEKMAKDYSLPYDTEQGVTGY